MYITELARAGFISSDIFMEKEKDRVRDISQPLRNDEHMT